MIVHITVEWTQMSMYGSTFTARSEYLDHWGTLSPSLCDTTIEFITVSIWV